MNQSNTSSRVEITKLWQARLKQAEEAYQERKRELDEVRDNPMFRDGVGVDGSHPFLQALKQETHALREYRRILRIFTDLVVRGVEPPAGDDQKD